MELFFDTETTGLTLYKEDAKHSGQPDVIQLAAVLSDADKIFAQLLCIVNPQQCNPNWVMSAEAEKTHGISKELVEKSGLNAVNAYEVFINMAEQADVLVCHNTDFDKKLVLTALHRLGRVDHYNFINNGEFYCTMKKSTGLCKLPGPYGYKWPKLSELHRFLFEEDFEGAHDALEDVKATRRCYYEMIRRGL